MHIDTQISRGLERVMAQNVGGMLDGMHGLSGLGTCENFNELETLSDEAGIPGASARTKRLRKNHACACERIKAALPLAVDTKNILEGLAGLGASPAKIQAKLVKAQAKAVKQLAKVQAKEAKQEAKVAAKVQKYTAAGKTAKANKVIAKDVKQDAKVAAKVVKIEGKINAAADAIAQFAAAQPAAVTTPTQTAAAVLAQQANVQAVTPAAQQLMQEVVANAAAPGSVVPTQSLATPTPEQYAMQPSGGGGGGISYPTGTGPATEEAPAGFFDNIPPIALALAGGAALFFFMPKGKKG